MRELLDVALWLFTQGYVAAFLLGVIVALQIVIVWNARLLKKQAKGKS